MMLRFSSVGMVWMFLFAMVVAFCGTGLATVPDRDGPTVIVPEVDAVDAVEDEDEDDEDDDEDESEEAPTEGEERDGEAEGKGEEAGDAETSEDGAEAEASDDSAGGSKSQEDKDGKEKKAAGQKKDTAKDKKPAKSDEDADKKHIALDGVFVASSMTPISRRLEEWTAMTIVKIVEHGTQVHSGDTLVTLDMEGIDRSIVDLEQAIALEKLSLTSSRRELELLRQTTEMDLTEARREFEFARDDWNRFVRRDKEMMVASQNASLKAQQNRLAYQEEELNQLLKMYEADDLTEETEEIILKRTRDQVEQMRFYMKQAMVYHEDFFNIDLPRREERSRRENQRSEIALRRAELTLPSMLRKAELALQKEEVGHQRSLEKLATLKRDRQSMIIKAPCDGIVYYGECDHGKFPGARGESVKMRPHGSLKSGQVFMTLLDLRPLHILADVQEDKVRHVKAGSVVKVTPKAYPEMEFSAKIAEVSRFPVSQGTFSVRLTCRFGPKSQRVVPGMACAVKIPNDSESKSESGKDKKAS